MSEFYQELCNMLIRPTRQIYHLYDLGNPIISTYGKRQDFQIFTKNRNKVKCSYYRNAFQNNNESTSLPTVIYLHSLNGSRLQFLTNIQPLMKKGFSISTLDFAGCGLSDGAYVTLGAHEKYDVLQLLKYISQTYKQQKFLIWGRSMGAVAAIKFFSLFQQQKNYVRQLEKMQILGLVLDSPFYSLNQLAVQIAKNKINIPQIVIKMVFYMIQSSIQTKANFKTSQLEMQNDVKKLQSPSMILTSKKDTLVPYEHSLNIYKNIPNQDKRLVYIQSEHNSNRQQKDIEKIYRFLQEKSKFTQKPRNSFLTGSFDRVIGSEKSKSVKKRQNLTLSKQKSKNPLQKNKFMPQNNPNFFFSHVGQQNQIRIQDFAEKSPSRQRTKEFSFEKIMIPKEKQLNEFMENQRKQILNESIENKVCYSADRPRVIFRNDLYQSCAQNYNSLKKQPLNPSDFDSIGLASIPQRKLTNKNCIHASSYKNIECLKTIKKIKRLEPNSEKQIRQVKEKQEILKSHMNIITAKLKKKSKNEMIKSFLPHQVMYINQQITPTSQKTLRKQGNVSKSSTNLQFLSKNKSEVVDPIKKTTLKQKPWTPSYASNREIIFTQQVAKPFTPQIPLNSSMRINEISNRKQSSKQEIMKMYSLFPINENNRGLTTTLNIKYSSNTKDNNIKQKQYLSQSIGEGHQIIRPQFIHSKNALNNQAIPIKNDNSINRSKKLIFSDSKVHSNGNPVDESTFLK